MDVSNAQISAAFEKLAAVYSAPENEGLTQPILVTMVYTKEDLIRWLRAVGGKFKKRYYGDESMYMDSVDFPGIRACVPRDKVCRKVVTWDCEPLLSPEDEAEVEAAAL